MTLKSEPHLNVAVIESVGKYIEHTTALSALMPYSVLYRGQAKYRSLLPSVARRDPTRDTGPEEQRILKQLRLRGASYIDVKHDDTLDMLVLAQHFGMPTRLLDWSSNPLAALWFACHAGHADDLESRYVYALIADDVMLDDPYAGDPFDPLGTKAFQPRLLNPRIIAQHGWFTLHRFSRTSKRFVALEHHADMQNRLYEMVVPGDQRSNILATLDECGINESTLFPDLEGLCKYIGRKFNEGHFDIARTRPFPDDKSLW
ncbi:FRG domain-containing protein [Cupriavidus oxalaticus]|uniref:FRG domain-containing protein n=1 Tax=Cupriavidus oxalaticus TaxID=96344 RepID=UPI003F737B5E